MTHHRVHPSLPALCALAVLLLWILQAAASAPAHPSQRFGELLFKEDFNSGLSQWHLELERGGEVSADAGALHINVPAGATVWFKHPLNGPVAIIFDATAIQAGGSNDRVSDLNCFWMASNPDGTAPVYAHKRSGRFADYNTLLTYYVGLGGNTNTTTRFRRYIGDPVQRPLLPEHDLSAPDTLLAPNRTQTITLVADGNEIEYWRDATRLFSYHDPSPYRRGWFALRTTQSHLRIERLRIHSLKPGDRQ